MKGSLLHVIMAGGSGTRFWPVSRAGHPKQFLALAGDLPLIRQAHDRAAAMSGAASVFVAAGTAHRQMVLDALPGFDSARFIGEPCARNTASCVGLAALHLRRVDPDSTMVVAPADHVYGDPAELQRAIALAARAAAGDNRLVTLGIRPSRVETGYGYIEVGEPDEPGLPGVKRAKRFVEKPDAVTAKGYVAGGRHLWNSGVFVWRTRAILEAIETHAPEIWEHLRRIDEALGRPDEEQVVREAFDALPSISIDYAIMEKAPDVLVVPADPGWSDVGSWDAVAELQDSDAAGNGMIAPAGDVLHVNSSNCFTFSSTGRFIALVGAADLLVIDAGDALLVCRRGDSQSVRAVVEALKARGRGDLL